MDYERQTTENLSFQEYADLHFGGNRMRAVHELLYYSENGLSAYIDDLTQEEASFIVYLLQKHAFSAYGGEAGFAKALHAETLAETLELNTDDIHPDTPNPFVKSLKRKLLGLLGAIVFSVAASLLAPHIQADLSFIGEILIGLCSLSVAGEVFSIFRFNRLKKEVSQLPDAETLKANTPEAIPFEEAYAGFMRNNQPEITLQEGKARMKDAVKQIAVAIVYLLILGAVDLLCIEAIAETGLFTLFCCMAIVLAYCLWQGYMLFKMAFATKAVSGICDADEQTKKSIIKRQQLIAIVSVIVILLYVAAFFLSIFAFISVI